MSKKYKKIFKLLTLSPTLFLPFTAISQSTTNPGGGNSAGQGSSQQGNGSTQTPAEPPKNAEDFDSFKEISETALKQMVTRAIDNFISWVDDQKQRAEKLEEDYQKKLSKITYFNLLLNYFKKNKDKLIENPSANELNVIFPLVVGTNRNVNISKIKYNNEDFNGVWAGLSHPTDYVAPLGEGTTFEVTEKNSVNSWNKKKLEESLKKYSDDLLSKFNSLIYNEADIPKIDKDYFLNLEDDPSQNRYKINPPNGYESWDQYIISKFKPRVSKFDLEKNIELTKEEEEQQNPQPQPTPPQNDNPTNDKPSDPVNTKEVSQGIPPLNPELKWNHNTGGDLVAKFNSNPDIFFFKNPVNTRYQYKVTEVKKDGGKYIATVELSDTVNTSAKRTYKSEVKVHENNKTAALTELTYKTISKVFVDLYKSLGIDEKLDYLKLESDVVADALFQIVNSGVQLINTESFVKNYGGVQNAYADDVSLNLVTSQVQNTKGFEDNLVELTLAATKTSTINNYPFYFQIVNALNTKKDRLKARITNNNEKITNELSEKGMDISQINTFFNNLETKIYKLRKSADLSTFNVIKWYERFIENIKVVSEELILLQKVIGEVKTSNTSSVSRTSSTISPGNTLAQEKNQSSEQNSNNETQKQAYNEILKRNKEETTANGSIIRGFGISLLAVGLLASIVNAFILVKAFTMERWKQYRKLSILLATSFVVAIIVGAILLILGL